MSFIDLFYCLDFLLPSIRSERPCNKKVSNLFYKIDRKLQCFSLKTEAGFFQAEIREADYQRIVWHKFQQFKHKNNYEEGGREGGTIN